MGLRGLGNNAGYAKRMSPATKEQMALRYAEDMKAGRPTEWGTLSPKQIRAVKEQAVNKGYIDRDFLHNNNLSTPVPARGYSLRDRDTGEILKYGDTTKPGTTRYSQAYLDRVNARMLRKRAERRVRCISGSTRKFLSTFGSLACVQG